jgi:hypothetical protein
VSERDTAAAERQRILKLLREIRGPKPGIDDDSYVWGWWTGLDDLRKAIATSGDPS